MRKEIIFTTAAGVILGIIIAFGVWRINSSLETEDAVTETVNNSEENNNKTSGEEFTISLSGPDNYDVITKKPLVVTGLTKANSKLIISAEEEDYVISTNENGEFSASVDLVGGVNQLLFLAVDENNESNTKELVLIYSTEFEN